MSRSRRKHPFCGITTAESEKWNKRFWSRGLRVRVRMALEHEAEVLPEPHEVGLRYGEKDGKQRFDPDRHPYLMRK